MHPTHYYKSVYQLLCLSITLPCFLCSSVDDPQYVNCNQPFKCGNSSVLGDLKYPFWGINRPSYCGEPGLELRCLDNTPVFNIATLDLRIIETNQQVDKFTVVFNDFWNNPCPSAVFNRKNNTSTAYKSVLSLNSGSLFTNSSFRLLTILYGCPPQLGNQLGWLDSSSCSVNNREVYVHFVTQTVNVSLTRGCDSVVSLLIPEEKVQALEESTISLPEALDEGFEMNWFPLEDTQCKLCMRSGGHCGYNSTQTRFKCYCRDQPYELYCSQSKRGQHKKIVSITAVAAGIVILVFLIFFSKHFLQKCKPIPQDQRVEDCLKNYTSTSPRRYTYANIKKMTNSFKQKLGEGGYGAVFKGSLLHDGRAVAVKLWKQSKGDGQDFVNEVMSISRTSHVNIVSLLGFCFEGPKRALIYEFMPNGSLEKFIRGRDSNDKNQSLSAPKLLEIVVGIARGLEYLHRGCNTRIVHFDIKPHNILLDEEFTPKISDFGLAKSYKQKESIISMSGARGTIGYIAPEVILRSFGGVSHKSDVYSFGMMTLEMVGCTKRLNQNVENSSEMYFPQWIYKQLEQETTLDSGGIVNEEERELERKMILVGLWCIQTNPMGRPSMSRVVEMLDGEVELLQVPPIPSFASPPRQQPTDNGSCSFQSSTTSTCL